MCPVTLHTAGPPLPPPHSAYLLPHVYLSMCAVQLVAGLLFVTPLPYIPLWTGLQHPFGTPIVSICVVPFFLGQEGAYIWPWIACAHGRCVALLTRTVTYRARTFTTALTVVRVLLPVYMTPTHGPFALHTRFAVTRALFTDAYTPAPATCRRVSISGSRLVLHGRCSG